MERAPAPVRSRLATAAAIAWLLVLPAIDASGAGPVVGWGLGRAPNAVNGVDGTPSAIAAGEFFHQHICAIQAETGAVVCWGENMLGSDTPPDAVNGTDGTASAIEAGSYHGRAIKAGNGAVVCWGLDFYGETMPPPSVDGTAGIATAISAGRKISCAIRAGANQVAWWGDSGFGADLPPPSVNGVAGRAIAIAAGDGHVLAIRAPEPTGSALGVAGLLALALLARRRPVLAWPIAARSELRFYTAPPPCPSFPKSRPRAGASRRCWSVARSTPSTPRRRAISS